MKAIMAAAAIAGLFAVSPAFADPDATSAGPAADSRGTATPAPGVSPPASKTVVPEIPANKEPKTETEVPKSSAAGAGPGTSGSDDTHSQSTPPARQN